MKKCLLCNSEFTDEKLFCPDCGAKLEEISGNRPTDHGDTSVKKLAVDQGGAPVKKPAPDQRTASAQKSAPKQESAPEPEVIPKPYQASGTTAKSSSSVILPVVILSVLAFVSLITAVIFFFQKNDYSRRLDTSRQAENNMRRELEQVKSELAECQNAFVQVQLDLEQTRNDFVEMQMELEQYDGLEKLYGYGSENYYAEERVVIMKTSASRDLMIYANINGKIRFDGPGAGISCKWGEWAGGHRIPLTITGNSEGVYTIKFTNDKNSDSFEILVIVTDKN